MTAADQHSLGGAGRAIRSPRAAGLAGILFAVLMGTAAVLIRFATTPGEAGIEWVEDSAKHATVSLAVNLLPFAGIAFLWFIGVVRDQLGGGEDRLFATVFLGSGLLFVAMLFASGAVAAGLLLDSSDPDVYNFGREVTTDLLLVYAMRMAAVFTLSSSTLLTRLALVPRWLSIWGFLTALGLLAGAGQVRWLELAFPLWVLVLSIRILVVVNARHRGGDGAAAPVP